MLLPPDCCWVLSPCAESPAPHCVPAQRRARVAGVRRIVAALLLPTWSLQAQQNLPAARPPEPAHGAARASLLAADRAHAARSARALATGFPTALDRDVVLLYPDAPLVRGRAAAESLLRALPDVARRTLRWQPALAERSADGLRGYTLGYGQASSGDSVTPVRYLAYWRRSAAGAWHVAAWVLARGTPSAAPLPAPCRTPAAGGQRAGAPAQELRAADSAFAARSARDGAGPAFAAVVAPDGLTVSGSAGMTCGPAAVGAAFAGLGPGALVWAPTLADVAASGDLGMTVGTATVHAGAPAGAETSYSKYLTIWRRARDGAWRVVADAGNATPHR